MRHILILGAGFSRNWGGWLASEAFEYLLGCSEVLASSYLRDVLWRCQPTGGFEKAISIVRNDVKRDPTTLTGPLQDLQNAVSRMFDDMNAGYFGTVSFEFQQDRQRTVSTFLAKFDAIFTLNQDLLIETHYLNQDVSLLSNKRWDGAEMPGMKAHTIGAPRDRATLATTTWTPVIPSDFRMSERLQPYFKLHGSSNWKEPHSGSMLILGGDKVRDIQFSPLLSWYHEQFEGYLFAPETRLMVIGYGFRDQHINQVLESAIERHGTRMFVIGPDGGDSAAVVNPARPPSIRSESTLEAAFRRGLMGASRRPVREIFGHDEIEFAKVMRFFDR